MSDLDARVAALMEHVDALHHLYGVAIKPLGLAVFRANIENAIRAELQKPALHEPCSKEDAKRVIAAMGYFTSFDDDVTMMQAAIDSVLQGRAKPAQEEITDEQIEAAAKRLAACMDYPWVHMPAEGRNKMRINAQAIIRASKGEKT